MDPLTGLAILCAAALGAGIFSQSAKGEITIDLHQLIIRRMVIKDGFEKAGICGVKIKIKSKRKAPLHCEVKINYCGISNPFYFALEEKPSGTHVEKIEYDKETFMVHTWDNVLCFDTFAERLPAKIELVNINDPNDKTAKELNHEWAKHDRNGWIGVQDNNQVIQ